MVNLTSSVLDDDNDDEVDVDILKIMADENISGAKHFFGHLGEVKEFHGRSLGRKEVKDADILLVRSITRVDGELLADSAVRFVGTCTIGMDHIDQHYLKQKGVGFSAAPGSNANAVVDYVLAAITRLALDKGFSIRDKTVGIVGVGNVGARLKARLQAYGVNCLCCDPPLQRQAAEEAFVELDELLGKADIVSLHTPLTLSGDDRTRHLLNRHRLSSLKTGAILINSGRGPVIDNAALSDLLASRDDISTVLDVWENEPDIDSGLLEKVTLATPHIAGYSLEGKLAGTEMVYQAACDFLGVPAIQSLSDLLPKNQPLVPLDSCAEKGEQHLYQIIQQAYDIGKDDLKLRSLAATGGASLVRGFDAMRKNYPVRREFGRTCVAIGAADPSLRAQLCALGFKDYA